jgi:hypothetical protein
MAVSDITAKEKLAVQIQTILLFLIKKTLAVCDV